MQGNPVGSKIKLCKLITDNETAYIFGLWCADGYYWSSSIGITNVDKHIVERFSSFFKRLFPEERIKLRTYYPETHTKQPHTMRLAKQIAYQLYVNSRPLLRLFQQTEQELLLLQDTYLPAYFAGRFDGDGSIAKDLRSDLRIAYSNKKEAEYDNQLMKRMNCTSKVYHYQNARTFIVYVSRYSAEKFIKDIEPYSIKAQSLFYPVET